MLLIGAFGTVLEAIYQVFLASISSRYGAKSVILKIYVKFKREWAIKQAPVFTAPRPIKPTGPSRCKGEQNETL
jgi:hypothetical protein